MCCYYPVLVFQAEAKRPSVLQDGAVVHFKAKVTTPFRKLMTAYCDRQSVAAESVVFLFEGERLRGEQTPQEVSCLCASQV